jgi:RHS repeat-associated protein
VRTYTYDNANRKTHETWVNGSYTATYTYDAANELTGESDTFSAYTYTYDAASRLTGVDNHGTPSAPHLVLTYGYDGYNNLFAISDNLSGVINYDYDNNHQLIAAGMIVSLTQGPQVTLSYDTRNRLSGITREIAANGPTITSTNTYDDANRLTNLHHTSSQAGSLASYTYSYDAANQLTGYVGPDGTLTYTYDNNGQLTGVSGAHAETYTYDTNGNRTMTGYATGTGNRLTNDGTYTYTYDNEGNTLTKTRTSDGQTTTFTWDFRNRLTEVIVKTSGGTTVQDDKFTYDVENRRIGKNTLSGGQIWTAYDGVNPYADFNSSGSLTYRYLYGRAIDFLLSRFDGTTAMWYLTEKLGSVRQDASTSGTVLDQLVYDSYGNIVSETSASSGDRFKYTGREWDAEIAQYFYRGRYYGPTDGRFESEDPKAFGAGDTDLYRYVRNVPTNATDPLGLQENPNPFRFTKDKDLIRRRDEQEDTIKKLAKQINDVTAALNDEKNMQKNMDKTNDALRLGSLFPGVPVVRLGGTVVRLGGTLVTENVKSVLIDDTARLKKKLNVLAKQQNVEQQLLDKITAEMVSRGLPLK